MAKDALGLDEGQSVKAQIMTMMKVKTENMD